MGCRAGVLHVVAAEAQQPAGSPAEGGGRSLMLFKFGSPVCRSFCEMKELFCCFQ